MPIDYFDPVFFNNLQPKSRNRVATGQVAFLEDMSRSFTWCTAERVSDQAFAKKFGKDRRALYKMVGDGEYVNDTDNEWDDHLEDEDVNMEMSDAATVRDNAISIGSARETLSSNLSSRSDSTSGVSSISGVSNFSEG